ncbi:MAG: DeoR/GlpR transcriptional regulator [Clostridia bacterium]|nr:DeoR/GlpR transcriptional regulator [Clostridia bacterium]
MYQNERLDEILKIITRYKYVTVKFLTDELHYSTATINRDLNILAEQKLITRHYGGAELADNKGVPLRFRHHKMRAAKNKLGKAAAELIGDGDTVFIDATTTTQCIAQYITDKKDITVISNNMALIAYLSEYGVRCICLGGAVYEAPSMLCNMDTIEMASKYRADKHFFTSGGVTADGRIIGGEAYALLRNAMTDNSEKSYFLVDHAKYEKPLGIRTWCTIGDISAVISDFDFPEETKEKYKSTEFITV